MLQPSVMGEVGGFNAKTATILLLMAEAGPREDPTATHSH